MKKSVYSILCLLALFVVGCDNSKDSPEPQTNTLIDTKWQAEDAAANALYGGVNLQVIHFKDKDTYEVLFYHNGTLREDWLFSGTYEFNEGKYVKLFEWKGNQEWKERNLEIVDSKMMLAKKENGNTSYTYIKQ